MDTRNPLRVLAFSLLVVGFGWGIMYLSTEGIKIARDSLAETASRITFEVQKSSNDAQLAQAIEAVADLQEGDTDITEEEQRIISASRRKQTVTLIIGGDLMFDRGIRAIGDRAGYASLFDDSIRKLFARADLVIANLEGPITTNASKTLVDGKTTDSFTFTFPPETIEALQSVGISIVSLANNHIDNFGFQGYQDTQIYLRNAGIEWFGNPWNDTSTRLTLRTGSSDSPIATVIEHNGIRFAFVGYHAFQSGVDRVVAEIRRLDQPNTYIIVMPHWGEEYEAAPSERMRSYARAFVNAGADAIIAAHPHIIAENEWIGDVPVYYSIGNFLFDQYFSEEVKKGLLVELVVSSDGDEAVLERLTTYETAMRPGIGVKLAD